MRNPRASMLFQAFIMGYAFCVTILIVVLVRRHEELSRDYRVLRGRDASAYRGMTVPMFEAVPKGGQQPLTVGDPPEGGAQLVFLVRASCRYCKETIPVWQSLLTSVDSTNELATKNGARERPFSVVALAVEATADSSIAFVASHNLSVPVISFPDVRSRRLYRTSLTPQTLVIGQNGRVLFAKAGVFRAQAEIDSARRFATTPTGAAVGSTRPLSAVAK